MRIKPSGPREGCEAFHEREAASSRKPLRSIWPTMAAPWVLLVQLRQVRVGAAVGAVGLVALTAVGAGFLR